MTTTFNDIFEKILEDGQVDVAVTGQAAQSLRVSLVRRWNQHKEVYDKLGFLPDSQKNLALAAEQVQVSDGITGTRFLLRVKKTRVMYQIITAATEIIVPPGNNDSGVVNSEQNT